MYVLNSLKLLLVFFNSFEFAPMSRHSYSVQISKLNTKNTATFATANDSNGVSGSGASDEDFEELASDKDARHSMEVVQGDRLLKPTYAIGEWYQPNDRQNNMISVAILAFTGTNRKNDIILNVLDNGKYL